MNKVILMGRLTKDIEMRATQSGTMVANFTLAVNRRFSKEREAGFIPCQAWGKTAEFCERYFGKGNMIALSGRIQVSDWTDKEGKKRYKTEVIAEEVYFTGEKANAEQQVNTEQPSFDDIDDNELPF